MMRFLLYSHDGMGLGHVRRHLAIAAALTKMAPEVQVLLATSVDEVSSFGLPPNVDTLKLPGLRKVANDHYASRRLQLPSGEIGRMRSALLETAVHSFRPDVVLVDKHPFGASGEFRSALTAARRIGARTVLGFRDILDDAETVRREWSREKLEEGIEAHYDLILVYGAPTIFDMVREYRLTDSLAARIKYCGYVVQAPGESAANVDVFSWLPPGDQPVVLGTTGGGEDGGNLLKVFIEASAGAKWRGVVVAGPLMGDAEFRDLGALAAERRVAFHRFIPCLGSSFWLLDGLVCMGGYNTLVDAAYSGIPTVCVPRVTPRQEQRLRSEAFRNLGLLRTLLPGELSADRLREEILRTLEMPRTELHGRARRALDFDGACNAGALLLNLGSRPARHRKRAGSARPPTTLVSA